ncbi:MAG: hypothetical protein LRS46_03245 [Desulfurococcales archaeon]|nr:hypothetical protein [Desulfurococcales archaeon]
MEGLNKFLEDFFYARRRLVEKLLYHSMDELKLDLIKSATLLSPMLATCGPAGPNVAPFMVSFLVKEKYLGEALEELRRIEREYWGRGLDALKAAVRFLLDYVYNPDRSDVMTLVSHIMSRGHTWINIRATGEASLGILIPPDEGAYEIRVEARIEEKGDIYEYANRVHDLMHVIPEGRRSHPWYPALIMRIKEIYDNSYTALGRKIYG